MTVYFALAAIMLFLLPLNQLRSSDDRRSDLGQTIYLCIVALCFFLVIGLRGPEVGTDTAPYARSFIRISMFNDLGSALADSESGTPLFIAICWLIGRIAVEPQLLILAEAFIIIFFMYKYIKNSSTNYSLSVFLFFGLTLLFFSMNGSRQAMAMMVSVCALSKLCADFKSKEGWFLFICAAAIHMSSLVMVVGLVGIWLSKKEYSLTRLVVIFSVMGALAGPILNMATELIAGKFDHYTIYLSGSGVFSFTGVDSNGRIALIYMFLYMFVVIWLLKHGRSGFDRLPLVCMLLPMMAFGMMLGVFNAGNALTNRIVLYFMVPFICFIPTVLKQYDLGIRVVLAIGIMGALFAFDFMYLYEGQGGVTPYYFFWS